MKKLIQIAILAGAGWYGYQWLQKKATPEKIQQSAPVQYVNTLQQDVAKARAAAETAGKKIQQLSQDVEKNVKAAEGSR